MPQVEDSFKKADEAFVSKPDMVKNIIYVYDLKAEKLSSRRIAEIKKFP